MKFILFACLLCIVSCKSVGKKDVPIIPEKKLISLLVDFHLAQAITYTDIYRKKTINIREISLKDSIIKNHGYTKAIFDSTISFYSASPVIFEKLYDKVIDQLNLKFAETQQRNAKARESIILVNQQKAFHFKDSALRSFKFPKVFLEYYSYELSYPAKFDIVLNQRIKYLYQYVPKFDYIKSNKKEQETVKN